MASRDALEVEEPACARLRRRLRVYTAPKLLIIDKLGYLAMDSLEATLFFQLISARYTPGQYRLHF
ncbi:MAG: ATP-binding protein [Clostridia bacterium]